MSGRTPSNVELAEALGVPEKRLERMWEAMKHPVALDAPSQTDNKMTNVDFVEVGGIPVTRKGDIGRMGG